MLECRDVGLTYNNARILTGISLSIEVGEFVSIVGPSGSGKSTLLHCLSGLVRPSHGSVLYRGGRIDDLSEGRRAAVRLEHFGFVFQFGELLPELTILENVELPLRLLGVEGTPRYRAMALLEQLSIDHLADKPALQVSGGEGQRAAIARALVHEPSVIFADEPTGALDVANGGKVLGLLREMTDLRNITTVLVTHDTKIADASDRCVELIDGEVRIDRRTLMDSL